MYLIADFIHDPLRPLQNTPSVIAIIVVVPATAIAVLVSSSITSRCSCSRRFCCTGSLEAGVPAFAVALEVATAAFMPTLSTERVCVGAAWEVSELPRSAVFC